MTERITLIKFVNNETMIFNEEFYDTRWVRDETGGQYLNVTHIATKSTSLEASVDKILYVRYHIKTKSKENTHNE